MKVIILANRFGEAVGVDEPSGGYAYLPSRIEGVRFWRSVEEAEHYAEIWNRGGKDTYGLKTPLSVKEIDLPIQLAKSKY